MAVFLIRFFTQHESEINFLLRLVHHTQPQRLLPRKTRQYRLPHVVRAGSLLTSDVFRLNVSPDNELLLCTFLLPSSFPRASPRTRARALFFRIRGFSFDSPRGKFSEIDGKFECTECAAGKYQSAEGATTCILW